MRGRAFPYKLPREPGSETNEAVAQGCPPMLACFHTLDAAVDVTLAPKDIRVLIVRPVNVFVSTAKGVKWQVDQAATQSIINADLILDDPGGPRVATGEGDSGGSSGDGCDSSRTEEGASSQGM